MKKYDVLSSLHRRDSPCSALRKQETKRQSVFQIRIYNAVDVQLRLFSINEKFVKGSVNNHILFRG